MVCPSSARRQRGVVVVPQLEQLVDVTGAFSFLGSGWCETSRGMGILGPGIPIVIEGRPSRCTMVEDDFGKAD